MRMYTIYDTKAEWYDDPRCIRTDGEARRAFEELAKDPNSKITKHPEDFLLYRIGSWDAENGVFTPEPGTCIAKAIEFNKGDE